MATDRADMISNLPDDVQGAIVSRLPTKDGYRTQALSRRWRPIWWFAPLNLDDGFCFKMGFGPPPAIPKRNDYLSKKTVASILSCHLGPFRRISIGFSHLHSRCDLCKGHKIVDDTVAGWIRSRAACLEELALVHRYFTECNTLPPSLFHRALVLRVATFGRCRLPSGLAVDYPLLRQLTLHKVTLTEEALGPLLAGCPALESLLLKEIMGSSSLRVSSSTLRSIGFCASWESYSHIVNVKELVIEDTPCLERLLPFNTDHGPAAIRVIHAPKLEVLGFLSKGTSQLHLGSTIVQELAAVDLITTMHTVKVLALHYVEPYLDAVLNVLTCFPCLPRLYIIVSANIG
ncbi:F-box/LRR-repeat protein 25-like [Aegilops tauschii subsp. strangulata]|uniref:F-box/LRR-repeat protein 25-like n=1 Tax=Aegilops tauschii subsp. strangulata TaxID=200361 RepID=UPI001ABC8DB4|nr:putative F-box/LRR-repeat protein At5g41840 [Aegilops tauschii subsp. strangulata]